MVVKKREIESLFKKMMIKAEKNAPKDKIYQKDMKTVGQFKVQWKICGFLGYQIYDLNKVAYKFGDKIKEPDVKLVIRDEELAIKFLKGERFEFDLNPGYKGGIKINYTEGWKIIDTGKGKKRVRINKPFISARFNKDKDYHPYILSKLPIFRNIVATRKAEEDIGYYIPINQSLGTFENQILPIKLIKHFIDKASNIVMMHSCGCRNFYDCKQHDKRLGCMYMGEDTKNLLIPEDKGHVATKEEALERINLAVEDGLIPLFGRAMDEAAGFGVEDTGKFLSMCFCCPCCCTNVRNVKYASSTLHFFHRIEGLQVLVNKDACVGCGECLEACVFDGMEIIKGLANVNQENCVGCGRCEYVCPEGAISINITDSSFVENLINKLESHVEVT